MPDEDFDPMEGILWQAFCNTYPYTIIVRAYLGGQHRIQITDSTVPDMGAPPMHGAIVQELCTYDARKAELFTDLFSLADDPVALARKLATDTNCEGPGCRIRLDDKASDHPKGFKRWKDA